MGQRHSAVEHTAHRAQAQVRVRECATIENIDQGSQCRLRQAASGAFGDRELAHLICCQVRQVQNHTAALERFRQSVPAVRRHHPLYPGHVEFDLEKRTLPFPRGHALKQRQ